MSERFLLMKRGLWWRPNSRGYCDGIMYAGSYSREEAESICGGTRSEVTMHGLDEVVARGVAEFDPEVVCAVMKKAGFNLLTPAEALTLRREALYTKVLEAELADLKIQIKNQAYEAEAVYRAVGDARIASGSGDQNAEGWRDRLWNLGSTLRKLCRP